MSGISSIQSFLNHLTCADFLMCPSCYSKSVFTYPKYAIHTQAVLTCRHCGVVSVAKLGKKKVKFGI